MTTPDEARKIAEWFAKVGGATISIGQGAWTLKRDGISPEFAEATAAALRSLADQLDAATKWQPMETAPRDGTVILACRIGVRGSVSLVYWVKPGPLDDPDGGYWAEDTSNMRPLRHRNSSRFTGWMLPPPREKQ